jgi:pimeloyl-ACP methyl ester carboxylesterase
MNTKGVNFQPSKRGQFSAAVDMLDGFADAGGTPLVQDETRAATVRMWGSGKLQHLVNPDMPWNEEIRVAWARMERYAASPGTWALMVPFIAELDVRALLPTVRVPTLILQHTDDLFIPPTQGKYLADHISGAKYVELPGRNMYHFVEPWRPSFQEIAEFLTGHQTEVADDRVLATVLFTDIVNSTRRAAEIGDRDWHALLDAHDAVVRHNSLAFEGAR